MASAQLAPLAQLSNVELKQEIHKLAGQEYVSLDYKQARIKMFNVIYLEKDENGFFNRDVYCQTKYYRTFKDNTPDEEIPDHTVMNTEHTWPQSRFNKELNEEIQKTDLHHLYTTFSKINAERGNYPFAEVGVTTNRKPLFCEGPKLGKPISYGEGVYFEPADEHKGNVARALFYFSVRYNVGISATEEIFLKFWHMVDPVDEIEKQRHEIIFSIQKNRNPFIDQPELVLKISDF
jgi:endonuclease I